MDVNRRNNPNQIPSPKYKDPVASAICCPIKDDPMNDRFGMATAANKVVKPQPTFFRNLMNDDLSFILAFQFGGDGENAVAAFCSCQNRNKRGSPRAFGYWD